MFGKLFRQGHSESHPPSQTAPQPVPRMSVSELLVGAAKFDGSRQLVVGSLELLGSYVHQRSGGNAFTGYTLRDKTNYVYSLRGIDGSASVPVISYCEIATGPVLLSAKVHCATEDLEEIPGVGIQIRKGDVYLVQNDGLFPDHFVTKLAST